jgi:hypothetical protein
MKSRGRYCTIMCWLVDPVFCPLPAAATVPRIMYPVQLTGHLHCVVVIAVTGRA